MYGLYLHYFEKKINKHTIRIRKEHETKQQQT